MVNFARCKVLGANVLRGPNQVPWDGKLEYDYQLWIDSDIVFDTNKFWQLCDLALPAEEEGRPISACLVGSEMCIRDRSIQISQDYSSMVNFARCKVLGANVLRGPNQIPWDGKLKYDYQLWIDSDIVFDTNKFWQLCDLAPVSYTHLTLPTNREV